MRKALSLICWFFAGVSAAQEQILNGGFEHWKDSLNHRFPQHWSVQMVAALYHSPSDSAWEGKKALVLSTWYSYVEGHLFYGEHGNPDHRNWTQHTVPFFGRPEKLAGWFRYTNTVNPDDSAAGHVLLLTENNDTLAYGQTFFPSENKWTRFEIPLLYFSAKPARKTAIYFTSAVRGRGMNDDNYPNRLYLDGLEFVYGKKE